MFTAEQYRAKAIEYSNLVGIANSPNEVSEFQRLERSFTELADNAQWMTDNHNKTVPPAQSTRSSEGQWMNHSPGDYATAPRRTVRRANPGTQLERSFKRRKLWATGNSRRSILGRRANQGAEAIQAENGDLVLDALHSSRGSLSRAGHEAPFSADASGQTVCPQSRPRHHLTRLLVLAVRHSERDPVCDPAGDHQDCLRPYSAAGCIRLFPWGLNPAELAWGWINWPPEVSNSAQLSPWRETLLETEGDSPLLEKTNVSEPSDNSRQLLEQPEDTKMYMSGDSLLIIMVVGLIAGWLAGEIVQGTGFGIVGDLLIGIAGAFIGSWLLPQLGLHLGSGMISAIINAATGALLLLLIIRLVRGGGGWRRGWGGRRRWGGSWGRR
jgi:uncharacterized membrane protein YeaQ/YmgE (transglycosylase-associated protein family)